MKAGFKIVNYYPVIASQKPTLIVVANYHASNEVLNMSTTLTKQKMIQDKNVIGIWIIKEKTFKKVKFSTHEKNNETL